MWDSEEAEHTGKKEAWPEAVTVVLERGSKSQGCRRPQKEAGTRPSKKEDRQNTGHRTRRPVEPGEARPRHLKCPEGNVVDENQKPRAVLPQSLELP